ncbi:MAG: DUF58 domain-containing protein [Zoogloeaceae bacterium]|jgi:uncharacterized protein (DUF58 family)|nr:DUF58 domain-containing protein [Zoogloeaceae bacterium]
MWFSRRPVAAAPFVVVARVYILPARMGLLYAVTLLAMLLTAINYNLSLGFALVFLLTGLFFVAMLHTHRNLARLSLRALENPPVFAGDFARFSLLAETPDVPRPALEAQSLSFARRDIPEKSPLPVVLLHLEGKSARFQMSLTAPCRGWLTLPPLLLATRYPLGLFRAWTRVFLSARCLVYPRPIFLPWARASDVSGGDSGQSDLGEEDFSGLRARQLSDSPRHIAWKAVARDGGEGELLAKRFSGGAKGERWFSWEMAAEAIARHIAPEGLRRDHETETRLSVLSGWVDAAEREGISYGLALPGFEAGPSRGAEHFSRCMSALALFSLPEAGA